MTPKPLGPRPLGNPQLPKNHPIELGLKFTLGAGQLYARLSAQIPFRYRGIFLVHGAEEVGPLFSQRPHALTQGMHESEVLEVRQAEPHAMPDYVVLLFGFWWVFQPQKVFRDPQQLAKTPVKRIEMCTAI